MIEAEALRRLDSIMRDRSWQNGSSQVKARAYFRDLHLKSEPKWTYNSAQVVRTATLLQGLGGQFLEPGREWHDAIEVGRFWEALSRLNGDQNAGTALLAALSYELAGSSANSAAMITKFKTANSGAPEPSALVSCVNLLLQRRLLSLRSELKLMRPDDYAAMGLAASGIMEAIEEFTEYLLSGDLQHLKSAVVTIDATIAVSASEGAVVEHLISTGIKRLMSLVETRGVWSILGDVTTGTPRLWRRYLQLLARGLGRDLMRGHSITELWPSQREAIKKGLLDTTKDSLAVRMPTSAGKTRVAEIAMVKALADDEDAKVVYIAPYRALANELSAGFKRLFGDLGYSVRTSLASFDYELLERELLDDADIAVLTPERLDLFSRLEATALDRVSLVVLDEGHILADENRGVKTELLLTRLRRRLPNARFLVASAVISERVLDDVSAWLSSRAEGSQSIASEWRPALQQLAVCRERGKGWALEFVDQKYPEKEQFLPGIIRPRIVEFVNEATQRINKRTFPNDKGDIAAELALRLSELGPVLVYSALPDWTGAIATRIQDIVEIDPELRPAWWGNIGDTVGRADQIARDWYADGNIPYWLSKGLAIHNGDLPEALKDAIEKDARDGRFRIIVATGTLSAGVNIPIRSVVIHSYGRFEGKRSIPMPASDYWNIIGRAGRAGFETEGLAVHIIQDQSDEDAWANYLKFPKIGEELKSGLLSLGRLLDQGIMEPEEIGALLDPEILPLLAEDLSTEHFHEILEDLLSRSLAHRQAIEKAELRALSSALRDQVNRILDNVPSATARLVFSQTGLSSERCLHIYDSLLASEEIRDALFAAPTIDLAKKVLPIVLSMREDASESRSSQVTLPPLLAWLEGSAIADVHELLATDGLDQLRAQKIVDREFRYRIPWHTSALLRIASFAYGDDIQSYSRQARLLPAMLRSGLPDVAACYAASLGVPTRIAAIRIADAFRDEVSDWDGSFATFNRWMIDAPIESMARMLDVHGKLLEDVLDGLQASGRRRSVLDSFRNDEVLPRVVRVRTMKGVASTLVVGRVLACRRAYSNLLDHNEVQVLDREIVVGKLGNDDERIIAAEIDSGADVRAVVLEIAVRTRAVVLRLMRDSAGP